MTVNEPDAGVPAGGGVKDEITEAVMGVLVSRGWVFDAQKKRDLKAALDRIRAEGRCARDSDWCDGMLCHDPPHGIGMNPGCPNAEPVALKSTCDKRPDCGCSVECRDYLDRVRAEHAEGERCGWPDVQVSAERAEGAHLAAIRKIDAIRAERAEGEGAERDEARAIAEAERLGHDEEIARRRKAEAALDRAREALEAAQPWVALCIHHHYDSDRISLHTFIEGEGSLVTYELTREAAIELATKLLLEARLR